MPPRSISSPHRLSRHRERTGIFALHWVPLLALACTAGWISQSRGMRAAADPGAKWTPVSDGVLKQLTDAGKKIGYPGSGTAGVSVDRASGRVNMIVPDQGVWTSSDDGQTFARADGGAVGGRCETGYALNADPAGSRLACFMLDGSSAMTLDGGKTWSGFQAMGRGWDFGAVDWSQAAPKTILAIHHESGEELQLSLDAGKSWKLLGKEYKAVGVFGPHSLVTTKGDGILRSTDDGTTWTRVSDLTPTGRVLCVFGHTGYWVSRQGLLVSHDEGKTWVLQGSALEAAWGPFFGKSEKEIAVVARVGTQAGFYRSSDSGQTWRLSAPFPEFGPNARQDWTPSKQWAAGWFANFGWDPVHDSYFASRMGFPTFRFQPDR